MFEKQPEANAELFEFAEDALIHLDTSPGQVAANFPLFFALNLAGFFGLRINDNYSEKNTILDLQDGNFTDEKPSHPYFIEEKEAKITSDILRVMQPSELEQVLES